MNIFKKIKIPFLVIQLITYLFLAGILPAQISITPNNADGIYQVGETVKWTLEKNDTFNLEPVRYTLKKGGLTPDGEGFIAFSGNMSEVSYTFDSPGAIILDIRWGEKDTRRNKVVGGAIADPDKIELSGSKPADFDMFWESKIKELSSIQANPVLKKGESGIEGVDYTGDERSEAELTADCEDKGGKFNPCASSCPPDAEACIAMCVPKCEFEK